MKFRRNIEKFSQLGHTFNCLDWILEYVIQLITSKSVASIKQVKRIRRAVSLSENLNLPTSTYPEIEILSVVAGKDIEVLTYALESALRTSKNPVGQISIICPIRDIESCKNKVLGIEFQGRIQVISEDAVLNVDRRNQIRSNFGNRYGWVLQQFLAVEHIYSSEYSGVLLLNSDTILLKEVHWLDSFQNQILMVSHEYHRPYYLLLNKIMKYPKNPKYTFITHHMLFQPRNLREIFTDRGFETTDQLQKAVIANSDLNQISPLCIEFEPYAQGMYLDYSNWVYLRKFANKSVERSANNLSMISSSKAGTMWPNYNSISLHDYLQSESEF